MRHPPGKDMVQRARHLRRDMTDAERLLWSRLRARQLGVKFRSQTWLGGSIADFASVEAKLVIEVDDVLQNLDGVLRVIEDALPSLSHPPGGGRAPPSPLKGEGL